MADAFTTGIMVEGMLADPSTRTVLVYVGMFAMQVSSTMRREPFGYNLVSKQNILPSFQKRGLTSWHRAHHASSSTDLCFALHTFTIKLRFFSMYFTLGLPIDLEIRLVVKAFEVNAGEC